ncbi:unnamed protein product [Commensalibacter communis]|nr:unnamed protein product [Commensalibacter communis]
MMVGLNYSQIKNIYKVILNDYKEACLIKDKITFDLYEAIGVEKCQ